MGKSQRFGLCSMDIIFAFKLIMFDFVERIKEDLMLNVSIKKVWNNQRVFVINSGHALELVNYILEFIK